jgi:plastocyanin
MLSKVFLASAAFPAVFAQMTFNVTVGAGGNLAYNPNTVNAAPGDWINFIFNPKVRTHKASQGYIADNNIEPQCYAVVV